MNGRYCSECGQARIGPGDLSARRFANDLADETASLRFKFKTFASLRALLTPGLLTAEYLAGRRQRYLTPLQLYLVCAALFFLAAPVAGFTLTSMIAGDPSGSLARLATARSAERGVDPEVFNQRFDARVKTIYTIALGAGALVLAVLLQLLFRHGPFGAHLVFALHYFSFVYLATAIAGVSRRLYLLEASAAALGLCLMAAYLFVALRRIHTGSTAFILLKSAAALVLILACNYFADLTAVRLTLSLL
jgi:Protein of unknown function (DUF3667)